MEHVAWGMEHWFEKQGFVTLEKDKMKWRNGEKGLLVPVILLVSSSPGLLVFCIVAGFNLKKDRPSSLCLEQGTGLRAAMEYLTMKLTLSFR